MWEVGKVTPRWDESYKWYQFTKQPLMDYEINQWRSQGYYNDSFSGEMYDSKNIMPYWVSEVSRELNLDRCGYVIYRMHTLDIMPTHVDHFNTYSRLFNVERHNIRRAVVFLEDWKPGHYFEIAGYSKTNWKAGDYVMWSPDVSHAAANIGIEPRYTLQITGTPL